MTSGAPEDTIQPPTGVPTLADVARHANVSTATVSRCLNAPDKVGEATRNRVMAAVNELGYAPNFNARALAAKRTNTVGAVIPTIENTMLRGTAGLSGGAGPARIRCSSLLLATRRSGRNRSDPLWRAAQMRCCSLAIIAARSCTPFSSGATCARAVGI